MLKIGTKVYVSDTASVFAGRGGTITHVDKSCVPNTVEFDVPPYLNGARVTKSFFRNEELTEIKLPPRISQAEHDQDEWFINNLIGYIRAEHELAVKHDRRVNIGTIKTFIDTHYSE